MSIFKYHQLTFYKKLPGKKFHKQAKQNMYIQDFESIKSEGVNPYKDFKEERLYDKTRAT
jgi:hypothetical protein